MVIVNLSHVVDMEDADMALLNSIIQQTIPTNKIWPCCNTSVTVGQATSKVLCWLAALQRYICLALQPNLDGTE